MKAHHLKGLGISHWLEISPGESVRISVSCRQCGEVIQVRGGNPDNKCRPQYDNTVIVTMPHVCNKNKNVPVPPRDTVIEVKENDYDGDDKRTLAYSDGRRSDGGDLLARCYFEQHEGNASAYHWWRIPGKEKWEK